MEILRKTCPRYRACRKNRLNAWPEIGKKDLKEDDFSKEKKCLYELTARVFSNESGSLGQDSKDFICNFVTEKN